MRPRRRSGIDEGDGGVSGITRTADGFVVDAVLLGCAFGLDPAEVPVLMRSGVIKGHHEKGVGADAGRHCLAFSHSGRTFRITLDAAGRIVSQSMSRPILRGRLPARSAE